MSARKLLVLLLLALLVCSADVAGASIDDLLASASADGSVRVIVKLYAPGMLPESVLQDDRWAVLLQRLDIVDLQDAALSLLAGTDHTVMWRYATSPYMALDVTPAALLALIASPFIEEIAPDFDLVPRLAQSGPFIQAPETHVLGVTGAGQTVVIIDDGVDRSHPFFAGRLVEEWCTVSSAGGCPGGASGAGAAAPVSAHGTHVAGTAAGAGGTYSGVAPGAHVVAIRVFGTNGSATFADVKAALDRAIVLKDTRTIAAVNMSLGAVGFLSSSSCDGVDAPYGLKTDIDVLRAAGIATVVASGNDGSASSIGYPACISTAIKVGATTKSGAISGYSDLAPAQESATLLAPGGDGSSSGAGNICASRPASIATSRGTCAAPGIGGAYGYEAGTSMATPHVTGAWALLKQVKPSASVDEVLAAFRATGVSVTDPASGAVYRRVRVRDAIATLTALSVTIDADRSSPQPVGATVRFTATPSGGVGTVSFKWRVHDGSTWTGTQNWSTSATFDWTPAQSGSFTIEVSTRSATITADAADGPAAIATRAFAIETPAPTATTLSPSSATAGGAAFTLTVTGAGFVPSSSVRWNGTPRTTTYVSATQLQAAITAADLATGGPASVTVFTPAPGGGTSGALTFTVNNGVPTIAGLTPIHVVAGTLGLELTIRGTNFSPSSTVTVQGSPVARPTTFVSATELRATLWVADVAAIGTVTLGVVNPAPGGGTATTTLPVIAPPPAPTAASVAPASLAVGAAARTITVTGASFIATSRVQANGADRPTTYVSATALTATLTSADVAATTTLTLRVVTPAPGGGTSSTVPLFVGARVALDRTVTTPTGQFVATLATGPGQQGEWLGLHPAGTTGNGGYVDWQYPAGGRTNNAGTSAGTLTWPSSPRTLPAGTYVVRWWSLGATTLLAQSGVITVADAPPVPAVTSTEPSSVVAGSSAFTLTVRGTGFRNTTVVRIGGVDRATTYVSETAVTTAVAASEIAGPGTLAVSVATPAANLQGGGVSSVVTVAVTTAPEAPTLTSLSPASLAIGASARTVTATGASFVPTSVVEVDGVARSTTYVSATTLTAVLTAADVAAAGTRTVRVMTPAPGGGTSSGVGLAITGPTLTLDRNAVTPTGTFTSTQAAGPAAQGEWLGLYPAGTTGYGGYMDWQYVGGGRTNNAATSASVMTWPSSPRSLPGGTYVVRWWSLGAALLLAQSSVITVADAPPVPELSSVEPASVVAGGSAFTLTARGSGFRNTSVVRIDGVDRATTFGGETALSVTIAASEIASTGNLTVDVRTPPNTSGQGGGTSGTRPVAITAPPAAPTVTSLSPTSLAVGATPRTVTVTGTNFVPISSVEVDSAARSTTYVSATTLTVVLTAADVAAGGTRTLRVVTPAPGGGTSSGVGLAITGPTLTLDRSAVTPTGTFASTQANGPAVAGEWLGLYPAGTTGHGGYLDWQYAAGGRTNTAGTAASVMTWPSSPRTLPAGTYVVRWWAPSATQLRAQSGVITVADAPPVPELSSLEPASVVAGASAFTLTVRGTGFRDTSVVRVGGADRATAYAGDTTLTLAIAASEIASAGSLSVDVRTPANGNGGGGVSVARTLAITAPPAAPTLTSLNPASLAVGATARTVTVTGTNFVPTTGVEVDGAARSTSYVSATTLTVVLTAADVSAGGTRTLRVVTPAPGGGTSSGVGLAITGPTLVLDRSSVAATGTFTSTQANGPAVAGEWLGLYPAGTTGHGGYVDWQYAVGGRTNTAATAASVATWPSSPRTLAAGTYVVRWWAPGATALVAQSGVITVVDAPPVPELSSLEPASVVAGGSAFTLTVRGTGFRDTSVARVGGADRATAYVGDTALTIAIAASEIASAGSLSVDVRTPASGNGGGGVSVARTLTITAPPAPPTLTSLSPSSLPVGATARMVTLTGTSFVPTSAAEVDGTTRSTSYVSATTLTVVLTAADVASGGTRTVRVITPAPGGGTSSGVGLPITGPTVALDRSTVTSIATFGSTQANGPAATGEWLGLHPSGSTGHGGYVDWQYAAGGRTNNAPTASSAVTWPSSPRSLPGGTYVVRWWAPGATALLGQSGVITILDVPPVPELSSLEPASVVAGASAFTLTLRGAGFRSTSVARVGGVDRATTFGGETVLTLAIAASEIASAGTLSIDVRTPANANGGGGVSAARTLTITPPPAAPTLASISPTSMTAGTASRMVTVTGMGFVAYSTVQVDGVSRATTYVSATELRVTLEASDVASATTRALRVSTAPPGGGTSGAATLTVVAQISGAPGLGDSASHPPPTSGPYAYYPTYGSFGPGQSGFPAVGQTFVDPVFGSTIRRLTNEVPQFSFSEIYAKNGYINANATLIYHRSPSGRRILNTTTGEVIRTGVPGNADSSFAPDDPDAWYWFTWGGTVLNKYRVSTGTSSVVKTFAQPLTTVGSSVDWIDSSGQYMVLHLGSALRVYDVRNDILYAGSIPDSYGAAGGWTGISPDARYVIAVTTGRQHNSFTIDHASRTVSTSPVMFWSLCGDHGDLVSASNGKTYFVTLECSDEAAVYAVDVSLPQSAANRPKQRADNRRIVKLASWTDTGAHFSGVAKGVLRDWFFFDIESGDDTFAAPVTGAWRPYQQEIVMANVLTGEVRRIAHHRSRSPSANYFYTPRVSVSADGSLVTWVSNFGNSASGYADLYAIRNPGGLIQTSAP